jgi:hypothetical protein
VKARLPGDLHLPVKPGADGALLHISESCEFIIAPSMQLLKYNTIIPKLEERCNNNINK